MPRFLLTCILIASIGIGLACSSGDESAIRETINGFWDAFNAGDDAKMRSYMVDSSQISLTFWLRSQRVSAGLEPAILVDVVEIKVNESLAYAEAKLSGEKDTRVTTLKKNEHGDWKIYSSFPMDYFPP